MTFRLHTDPAPWLWEKIGELAPENPFYTRPYAAARSALGDEALVISGFETSDLCPAFLRRGKMSSSLEIPSLPASPSAAFIQGLRGFCEREGIFEVILNTYASPVIDIPSLPSETERVARTEFIFDLNLDRAQWKIGRTHRQRIKQAQKNGARMLRSTAPESLKHHLGLIHASMRRRKGRGEPVAVGGEYPEVIELLRAGAAEIFQAAKDDEILSSMLVLKAARGGYDHSSGTRPEGMAVGASHFLVFSVAQALQEEHCKVFNLGGARADEAGLRDFKAAFGTVSRDNVMVRASLCTPTLRIATRAARAVRHGSAILARSLRRLR